MSLRVKCPCGKGLRIAESQVGRDVLCPNCNTRLSVGSPSSAVAQPQHTPVPVAAPPTVDGPVPQQWNDQPTNSNSGLIIGGIVAICVMSMVVVALAGFYFMRTRDKTADYQSNNVTNFESNPSNSTSRSRTDPYKSIPEKIRIAPPTSFSNSPIRSRSRSIQDSSSLGQMSLADLIEDVEPTVVRLDVTSGSSQGIGSGVIISDDGFIVTNFHVVQGARRIKVTNNSGQETYALGYFHADPLNDLAVIKIYAPKWNMKSIPLADFVPRKGESVAAFGSPLGFSFSATEGVVSSVRNGHEVKKALHSLTGIDVYSYLGYSTKSNWIQMTAAISGGNSGGPLVNTSGELIGINTWTVPDGQNLNFASTVDEVRSVVEFAAQSQLKSFSQLPKNRIIIKFQPPPVRQPGDVAGRPRRRPIRIPGGPTVPYSPSPGSRSSRGNSGSIRILTPEEAAAAREKTKNAIREIKEKRDGFERIVAADESAVFESGNEPGLSKIFATGESMIVDMSISHDGVYLAATNAEGTVYVFNFQDGKLLYEIESRHKLIRRTVLSKNPVQLYTIRDLGSEFAVWIREPETGDVIGKGLEYSGTGQGNVAAVSSDGRSVFGSWSSSSRVRFWRISALDDTSKVWNLTKTFGILSSRIPQCAVFSPDNRMLVTGFSDGWVSSTTGSGNQMRHVGSKAIHQGLVRDIAMSTDGKTIVTGGEDGQLVVTRWTQKKWRRDTYGVPVSEIYGVAYSKNDKFVAACLANNTIEIYSVDPNLLAATIKTKTICTAIEFFGNDRFVVVGCKDGNIRIYNIPQ